MAMDLATISVVGKVIVVQPCMPHQPLIAMVVQMPMGMGGPMKAMIFHTNPLNGLMQMAMDLAKIPMASHPMHVQMNGEILGEIDWVVETWIQMANPI
jgi:hypothetical protein